MCFLTDPSLPAADEIGKMMSNVMYKCGMDGIGIYSDVRLVCNGALILGTRILISPIINIFPTNYQSKSISSWWFEPDYFDKYAAHQFASFPPQNRGEHEQVCETIPSKS